MPDIQAAEKSMRIYRDEEGFRQIEIDGEPFPMFTRGDIAVTVETLRTKDGRPIKNAHVVMIPVFVGGELVVEGGDETLKAVHPSDD